MLVVDDRKQRTEFDYWFNIIKILGGNSPILVVFNEIGSSSSTNFDLNTYREHYKEVLIERCDVNLAAEDGRFQYLLSKVQEMVCKLEHVGDRLPIKWIQVREELEKLKKNFNYIRLSEYCDICRSNDILEESDHLLLSSYLHDLGIILHFQNDSELHDLVFLNPQWVANAIYTVLSDRDLHNKGGKFNKTWLFKRWDKKGYIYEQKNILLNLMKKNNFDICYELQLQDKDDKYYIAPQLLPIEKPYFSWNNKNNLNFRFQYPFMPKGIIVQLIVRLSTYIAQENGRDLVWQKGAIFIKNDLNRNQAYSIQNIDITKAEVIENFNTKKGLNVINIRVSGSPQERKALLTIILKEIREIHNKFKNLVVNELIPCNCQICNNNTEPFFYDYYLLCKYIKNKILEVRCEESTKMVKILYLIDDVIEINQLNQPIMNPQISPAERGIALAMALAVLIVFIVLVLNPRAMEGGTLAIIRFLAAAFAGISGYLLTGSLGLEAYVPLSKTNIKATGAFAAFVLVLLLFFYGVPASENSDKPKPISDAKTTITAIASVNQQSDRTERFTN
ncbi:COR domain-containing protein [Nostoc sp. LPT]|uniref:COR domain-containing protein n=1 Tax=Nostoc sp. LPT TaxID=2815387 RepID=UPI001D1F5563|nr:COR domain-containing protein [Nostoc sp. LPT]MBN4000764.1 hypothetical protein [Nostoc sp. LPT]